MDPEVVAAIIGFGGAVLGSAITVLTSQLPLNYSRKKELAEKQESISQKIIQLKKDELNTYQEEFNQCVRIESEVKKVEHSCAYCIEVGVENEDVLSLFCTNLSNYNPIPAWVSLDDALCELVLKIDVYRTKKKAQANNKEDHQKSIKEILHSARVVRGLCAKERLSAIAKITQLQNEILHLEADCVKNYVDFMREKKRKKRNQTQKNSVDKRTTL